MLLIDLISYLRYAGSPKKRKNWKTTRGLLTDILEEIKGPSAKTKMIVMLIEFF